VSGASNCDIGFVLMFFAIGLVPVVAVACAGLLVYALIRLAVTKRFSRFVTGWMAAMAIVLVVALTPETISYVNDIPRLREAGVAQDWTLGQHAGFVLNSTAINVASGGSYLSALTDRIAPHHQCW
jgi:hypothetical protein